MKGDINITSRYGDGDYLSKNKDWHVEDSPWKASEIHKIIQRNKLNVQTVCEVGCGAGEILNQLSLKDDYGHIKFFGYEISDDAFELCSKRESDNIHFFKEDLIEVQKKFDVVLCIDVFEHVENYMGFVRNLREKGKYKIFHIPLDLSVLSLIRGSLIHHRNTVGHLHHFNPDTAVATLIDCGYEIVDTMYTAHFADQPAKSWKAKILKFPRKILYKISPKLMSTLIGGSSLMVLAK